MRRSSSPVTAAEGITTSDRPTLTITDNDTAPTSITLSCQPARPARGILKDANSAVTVTATLDGNATLATRLRLSPCPWTDGTAKAGSDYSDGQRHRDHTRGRVQRVQAS